MTTLQRLSDRRIVIEAKVTGGDTRTSLYKRSTALAAAITSNVAALLDIARSVDNASAPTASGATIDEAAVERFRETAEKSPAAILKAIEEFLAPEHDVIGAAIRKSDRRKHREKVSQKGG